MNYKLPLSYELIKTGGRRIMHLSPEGVVYASIGNTLVKTDDWGATWNDVYIFSASVNRVRQVKDGAILCSSGNKIYKSNVEKTSFAEVYVMDEGSSYNDFGFDVYDRVVLASTYGQFVGSAYMSDNYGGPGSWRKIFTAPNPRTDHIHDIKYDPYEGLIWLTTGDNEHVDLIFWSDDYGITWNTLSGLDRIRSTSIMPLPDCVVFGSDEYWEMSSYIYRRPKDGATMGTKVKLEKYLYKRNFPGSLMNWATKPAITYGENAKAYFGFRQSTENVHVPSIVWETDGISHRAIWIEEKLPRVLLEDNCGVLAVYGPDNNNNIAVSLFTEYDGEDIHLLKINLT